MFYLLSVDSRPLHVRYPDKKFWFRAEGNVFSSTTNIDIQEFEVVKETPKGVWLDVYGKRKFVLNLAYKRWAYPTAKEALESLIARKTRYLSILHARIRLAEEIREAAKDKLKEDPKCDSLSHRLKRTPLVLNSPPLK